VNHSPANIYSNVGSSISTFDSTSTIEGIVFIYLDHSRDGFIGFPDRFITPMEMSLMGTNARKPFFVVLDACHSTNFAGQVLLLLEQAGAPCKVGFLTPCDGDTAISHTNPDLVHTYDTQGVDHWMFCRAWLLDVMYRLPLDDPATLGEFPARLKNGFEASFQCIPPQMADERIRFFFPWGPIDPAPQSLVNRTAAFVQITHLWKGPGTSGDSGHFTVGTLPENGRGHLTSTIMAKRALPAYVPIEVIAERVINELEKARGGFLPTGEDKQWYEDLKEFVVDLNGQPPFGKGRYISRMYRVTVHADKQQCMQLIMSTRMAVAREKRIELEAEAE
jgi:hypothetical protein